MLVNTCHNTIIEIIIFQTYVLMAFANNSGKSDSLIMNN